MSKIVTIERDECIICGACWAECPEFFEEGPVEGFSQVVEEHQLDEDPSRGIAPDDLDDCVTEAADLCPVLIIHVEEG